MSTVRRGVKPERRSYLIFLLGLLAVASGLVACADGVRNFVDVRRPADAQDAASKDISKRNPYAFVGEEHNAEVDHVLREFAKEWKKNMKRADICASLNAITQKYLATKGKSAESGRFYAPDDPCQPGREAVKLGMEVKVRAAGVEYDANFSPRAIDLVNAVQEIMLTSSSAADVANRLVPINAEAISSMGSTDAALVLGVSSIAESSAAYWEANFITWLTVYSEGGILGPLPFLMGGVSSGPTANFVAPTINWSGVSEVGWADVGGGIVGGIRGGLGGPGGVLVGAGTGAAYASIGSAIGMIVKILQKV